jgi:hypothetical protein
MKRLILGLLLSGLPLAPASAQSGPIRAQQPAAVPQAPPPALPGLAARRPVAPLPPEQPNAALSPNAALFDAIGRGDLGAARDAVGRGANLNARNALGLTPLDAAVDQGRNDIAFFLLSARDTARTPAPPPESEIRPQPSLARPAATPRREAGPRAPAEPPRLAEPATARLWAGEGGTPRPEFGFLGFDAGRPAGGTPPRR